MLIFFGSEHSVELFGSDNTDLTSQTSRLQICPNLDNETWDWHSFETLPLNNVQFSLALTACFLLLICYLPGELLLSLLENFVSVVAVLEKY